MFSRARKGPEYARMRFVDSPDGHRVTEPEPPRRTVPSLSRSLCDPKRWIRLRLTADGTASFHVTGSVRQRYPGAKFMVAIVAEKPDLGTASRDGAGITLRRGPVLIRECTTNAQHAIDAGWDMPVLLGHETDRKAGHVVGLWNNDDGGIAALLAIDQIGMAHFTDTVEPACFVSLGETVIDSGESDEYDIRFDEISLTPEGKRDCSHAMLLGDLSFDCDHCTDRGVLSRLFPRSAIEGYIMDAREHETGTADMAKKAPPTMEEELQQYMKSMRSPQDVIGGFIEEQNLTKEEAQLLGEDGFNIVLRHYAENGDAAAARKGVADIINTFRASRGGNGTANDSTKETPAKKGSGKNGGKNADKDSDKDSGDDSETTGIDPVRLRDIFAELAKMGGFLLPDEERVDIKDIPLREQIPYMHTLAIKAGVRVRDLKSGSLPNLTMQDFMKNRYGSSGTTRRVPLPYTASAEY